MCVGAEAGRVHCFSQTLIDDPVVSNLLHKVKLGGYQPNNSFHGSCNNNQDTWGVNLLPEHQRDPAPRRFIACQAQSSAPHYLQTDLPLATTCPSPRTDRLANFTAENSRAPQTQLRVAGLRSLLPLPSPIVRSRQRTNSKEIGNPLSRVSLLPSVDT